MGWLSKFQSYRSWGDTHLCFGATQAPPNKNVIDLKLINFDNHPIFKIHNGLLLLTNVVFTNVPNILDHPIFVNLGCMPSLCFQCYVKVPRTNVPNNPLDNLYFVNLDSVPNFSFLGCLEVRRKDGLRVGCAGYVVGCAGYVVGGLRRLCGGFMHIIMPRCGSILQAGTC